MSKSVATKKPSCGATAHRSIADLLDPTPVILRDLRPHKAFQEPPEAVRAPVTTVQGSWATKARCAVSRMRFSLREGSRPGALVHKYNMRCPASFQDHYSMAPGAPTARC
jgi:hypothetical protein